MRQWSSGSRVSSARFSGGTVIIIVILSIFLGSAPAGASEKSEGWEFVVLPYLWMLSLDGTVTVKGQKSDVDMSFGDILENLNIAVMANLEARKGRFGMFVNPLYAQMEDDVSVETDTQPVNADVTVNMFILEGGVNYRLGPYALSATAGNKFPSVTVRPYIGARYTHLDGDINVKGDGLPSYDGTQDWVDPIVGAHTQWDFSRRWNVTLGGSIGGFGVGSDFSWTAMGLIGYRFNFSTNVTGNVLLGYRALYQDYDDGSGSNRFEWDTTMYGPIAGLSIGF